MILGSQIFLHPFHTFLSISKFLYPVHTTRPFWTWNPISDQNRTEFTLIPD